MSFSMDTFGISISWWLEDKKGNVAKKIIANKIKILIPNESKIYIYIDILF